ncbi:MAG: type I-B CRISPR-associated endonuclease Cas1b [Candidatus Bathyarchaeia archaeon]
MKKPLYIFSSGELRREGKTLVLIRPDDKKFIPVTAVSDVYVFGELTLNKRVLEFLSSNEVTVHFFNYYGYYIGSYYPRSHYNSGYMIVKQVEHYLDPVKRLAIARKFVEGALVNMWHVLHYYELRGVPVGDIANSIRELQANISSIGTIEGLMGVEGNARSRYYESFNLILKSKDFRFYGRTRRPPESRLDCLISFLNSLLYVAILREIYMTHLDPRIGFLHEANFRRFSLNLDVAEVFKPIIVDRLIFYLINKGMLDESHFMKELGGVMLNERGKELVVREFERKMATTIKIRPTGRKVSYRRLIRIELYKVEKHLMGEEEYKPLSAAW